MREFLFQAKDLRANTLKELALTFEAVHEKMELDVVAVAVAHGGRQFIYRRLEGRKGKLCNGMQFMSREEKLIKEPSRQSAR